MRRFGAYRVLFVPARLFCSKSSLLHWRGFRKQCACLPSARRSSAESTGPCGRHWLASLWKKTPWWLSLQNFAELQGTTSSVRDAGWGGERWGGGGEGNGGGRRWGGGDKKRLGKLLSVEGGDGRTGGGGGGESLATTVGGTDKEIGKAGGWEWGWGAVTQQFRNNLALSFSPKPSMFCQHWMKQHYYENGHWHLCTFSSVVNCNACLGSHPREVHELALVSGKMQFHIMQNTLRTEPPPPLPLQKGLIFKYCC